MNISQLRERYRELSERYAALKTEYKMEEQRFDRVKHGYAKRLDDMAKRLVSAWAAMHNARIDLKKEEERHERQQRLEGCNHIG